MEIICKIYLSNYLSYFSTFLLRIENPYTQWVWIANPDQRHADEHPRGRVNEHPPGRVINSLDSRNSCSKVINRSPLYLTLITAIMLMIYKRKNCLGYSEA